MVDNAFVNISNKKTNIVLHSKQSGGATGRQGCPNPDHYPDSEPASWSLNSYVLSAKQSSAQNLKF